VYTICALSAKCFVRMPVPAPMSANVDPMLSV
jgi:hypothetical protein